MVELRPGDALETMRVCFAAEQAADSGKAVKLAGVGALIRCLNFLVIQTLDCCQVMSYEAIQKNH